MTPSYELNQMALASLIKVVDTWSWLLQQQGYPQSPHSEQSDWHRDGVRTQEDLEVFRQMNVTEEIVALPLNHNN